ncbi:hypothetical protein JCM6882_000724 [Rhodosporidiobolus microsporus]
MGFVNLFTLVTFAASLSMVFSTPTLQARGELWDQITEIFGSCDCGDVYSKVFKCRSCLSDTNPGKPAFEFFDWVNQGGCKLGEYEPLMQSLESASLASVSSVSASSVSWESAVAEASSINSVAYESWSSSKLASEASVSSVAAAASSSAAQWTSTHINTAVPRGVSCPQELWDWRTQECRRDLTSTLTSTASALQTASAGASQTATAVAAAEESEDNGASATFGASGGALTMAVVLGGVLAFMQ